MSLMWESARGWRFGQTESALVRLGLVGVAIGRMLNAPLIMRVLLMGKIKDTRIFIKAPCKIFLPNGIVISGTTENINFSGVKIVQDIDPSLIGQCCRLLIILQEYPCIVGINFTAKIVQCDGSSISIMFAGVDIDNYQMFVNLMVANSLSPETLISELAANPGLEMV